MQRLRPRAGRSLSVEYEWPTHGLFRVQPLSAGLHIKGMNGLITLGGVLVLLLLAGSAIVF
jgi:hypothetical protein